MKIFLALWRLTKGKAQYSLSEVSFTDRWVDKKHITAFKANKRSSSKLWCTFMKLVKSQFAINEGPVKETVSKKRKKKKKRAFAAVCGRQDLLCEARRKKAWRVFGFWLDHRHLSQMFLPNDVDFGKKKRSYLVKSPSRICHPSACVSENSYMTCNETSQQNWKNLVRDSVWYSTHTPLSQLCSSGFLFLF